LTKLLLNKTKGNKEKINLWMDALTIDAASFLKLDEKKI